MGEAKRKREATSMATIGQGLLLPNPISFNSDESFSVRTMKPFECNNSVLYWDKIACPTNNSLHVKIPNEDTLIREGILLRPKSHLSGLSGLSWQAASQAARVEELLKLERDFPGYWAFSEDMLDELSQDSHFIDGRTYLVALRNALPLPPDDTAIDDLLEFRIQRKAELQNLQSKLREMYVKISESSDREFAASQQFTEIDNACKDIIKVSKERWKLIQFSDLKGAIPIGALAGSALGFSIQMPTTGAMLGAAGTLISVAAGVRRKLKSQRKLPFWYASEVSRVFK